MTDLSKIISIASRATGNRAVSRRYGYNAPRQSGLSYSQLYGAVAAAAAAMGGKWSSKKTKAKAKATRKAYKTSKTKIVKRQKNLASQVRQLRRIAESDMGTHIHRIRNTTRIISAVNGIRMDSKILNSFTNIEAVIAELRYYNPSAPTTLLNASGATGSYQKEFFFKRVYCNVEARNNYQVPCKVTLYLIQSKDDTSIVGSSSITNGLTDVGSGLVYTDALLYPTDSPQFVDLYRIVKSVKAELKPADKLSISVDCGSFQYDPSLSDSHALEFQRRFKDMQVLVRLEGVIGHDSVADEQGILQGAVDVVYDTTYEVNYAAGADIKYITLDNNASSFTNGGLVSSHPVSDNIGYSLA